MSNRLGGKQGTAYLGTNANQPPNWVFSDRDPNQYDVNNVSLGDMWLNQVDKSAWILVSLAGDPDSRGSLATWSSLANDGSGAISTLSGNTGGLVSGDNNANVSFIGDNVGITITGDPGSHTMTASLVGGGAAAQSFPTDDGTAIPAAGVLNIIAETANLNAGATVGFTGAGNTVTLNVTDNNDNTVIGKDSGNSTMSGGDNTILGESSGVSLSSGSDNIIIGGTSGNQLTSGSSNIIIGSGSGTSLGATDSDNTIIGGVGFAGATEFVSINAGSSDIVMFHNYPGTNASTSEGGNIFIGVDAGNFTLAGGAGQACNNALGEAALESLTTGYNNEAIGALSLNKLTTGTNNTAIGHNAGFNTGGDTGLVSGTDNVLIGNTAGSAYTAAESSNIIIGTVPGTVSESNTLRIGADTGTGTGEINAAFISGIRGITPASADGIPVFIGSDGQLGTVGDGGTTFISTATGNSGGAVGPLAGNINIIGDGTTAVVVGNPGTNTITISSLSGGGGDLTVITGDDGSATPAMGTINIITDFAAQSAGGTVLFEGAADTLTLKVSDGDNNTMIGVDAGNGTFSGTNNTILGAACGGDLTTGSANVIIGVSTGELITTGSSNVILGASAGDGFDTGANNIIIGSTAGSSYSSSESSNILLNAAGTVAESNALRIGDGTGTGSGQLNKSFISGIRGITPTVNDGIPVFINSVGQLGTVGSGGTTFISTVTGNSGGAVGPSAGNITIVGDGTTATVVGNPGTNTLTITALGGGGGDLTVLEGDVGSATPVAGTINILSGYAANEAGASVLFDGSGNTIKLMTTDSNANTLIGAATGNIALTGERNTGLGSICGQNITSGNSNILIGTYAGRDITTGSGNILVGDGTTATMLRGFTTAEGLYGFGANGSVFLHNYGGSISGNTFVGYNSAGNFNIGQLANNRNNSAIGVSTLSFLTTGTNNNVLGRGAGGALTTGSYNTLIGVAAGVNYSSSESSNICIGHNVIGSGTESNTMRLGVSTGTGVGQINRTFIAGIRGVTTGISNAIPVVIDSSGQLGTAGGSSFITTVTGNSGGPVSSSGGNINIVGDGVTVNVAGNPGTNTLTISSSAGGGDVAFATYLQVPYDVSIGGGQKIMYDTVLYNKGSGFNLGSSSFIAPVTGFYHFCANVSVTFPNPARIADKAGFGFLRNGGGLVTFSQQAFNWKNIQPTNVSPAFNFVVLSGSAYINLDAGDTIQVLFSKEPALSSYIYTVYGSSGSAGNQFSGSLITTTP